jgi:hypothetical protein
MWLMTQHGFYSIVQKEPGRYHVRGRERRDLENLVARVPLPEAPIQESRSTDYAARIVVGREQLAAVVQFLGASIDYDNFKARIALTPDQAHKPYHEVWQVLADALGAYGRLGRGPGQSPRR